MIRSNQLSLTSETPGVLQAAERTDSHSGGLTAAFRTTLRFVPCTLYCRPEGPFSPDSILAESQGAEGPAQDLLKPTVTNPRHSGGPSSCRADRLAFGWVDGSFQDDNKRRAYQVRIMTLALRISPRKLYAPTMRINNGRQPPGSATWRSRFR
jgi:hypothetical protein